MVTLTEFLKPATSGKLPEGSFIDTAGPHAPGDGVRCRFEAAAGVGYWDIVPVGQDMFLTVVNSMVTRPAQFYSVCDSWLTFHVRLSGRTVDTVGSYGDMLRQGPSLSTLVYAGGQSRIEQRLPGEHVQSVAITFRPAFFDRIDEADYADFPQRLKAFIAGRENGFHHAVRPLGSDIARTARDLLDCRLKGRMLTIFQQAKAMELFCQAVQTISQDDAQSQKSPVKITSLDREKLHAVKQDIEACGPDMPGIQELCRKHALNRNKLAYGFKALFATCVFDYFRTCRLEHAHRLLAETALPLTDIAAEIGYEHLSSFSRAFSAHFGISPSSLRKSC